jgi:hypothetical protein
LVCHLLIYFHSIVTLDCPCFITGTLLYSSAVTLIFHHSSTILARPFLLHHHLLILDHATVRGHPQFITLALLPLLLLTTRREIISVRRAPTNSNIFLLPIFSRRPPLLLRRY